MEEPMSGSPETPLVDVGAVAGSSTTPSPGTTAAPSSAQASPNPPAVPDYELLRQIGHGAYGDVWLARSKATGALRAAKIVWRNRFEDERPFRREFEGIQRFEQISREHPSQLALFHIGRNSAEGYFYYVMELADDLSAAGGRPSAEIRERVGDQPASTPQSALHTPHLYSPHTLRADLANGRLPAARVLEIGLVLTEALAHLHQHGLVHRDVKPSNVIFVNGRPKLADIGLVTDASDQCSIVGTEGYLPPEGPGTPQADIFALGKVLYEAATGMDRRHFPELPVDLRQWPDYHIAAELNEVVLRACAKKAAERYATCQEMRDELALLQRGKSVKRKRSAQWYWAVGRKAAAGLVIVAAVAALISLWTRQSSRSERSIYGPDSTNFDANAFCDKGFLILRSDDYADVGIAYTNFIKAIAKDPNFAKPYAGLLEIRVREDVNISGLGGRTAGELRSIKRHLEQLGPHLAATYLAQSVINWSDQNFPESERCIQEAIKANPNYEFAHTFYSWLLDCYGRPEEALEQLAIAQTIEPSKVIIYRAFGNTYYVARDYTNAIAWYRKAIEWESHHFAAYKGIGKCLMAMNDYTNALVYFEKADVLSGANAAWVTTRYEQGRRALGDGGIPGFWQQQLKWAENNTNSSFYWKAVIQIHLGKTNSALGLLKQSFTNRERGDGFETPLNSLLYDDCWDRLHNNPDFTNLLNQVGFTKVMRPQKK